ncbi:MAG TPA: metalloregulator ArsR/SmtB family transcription factor [Ilumatobacteraceae bacterium]
MVVDPLDPGQQTDLVFHALADATRRDIVRSVLETEQSVSGLARRYPMSFAAVHKHVAVLERAGLVTKRRSGREQLVRGRLEAARRAYDVFEELEAVWRGRMDRFEQILAEPETEPDRQGSTQ